MADRNNSLLFTGLLINRETVVPILQWLHTISFFHAAFEALAVNELRYLQLKQVKVRADILHSPSNLAYLGCVVRCGVRRSGCYDPFDFRTSRTGI